MRGRGESMDDATALRNRVRQRSPTGLARAVLGPQIEPHHRRRRLVALLVLAGLALGIGAAAGAGGGATARHRAVAIRSGFFAEIATVAGDGPASFVAEQQADENAAIDRTLAITPYVRVAGNQHREIALTFDDGPGPYTPAVLAVLERMHVPATFFEVGVEEQYFHASTVAIVAQGDPIGDHTQLHAPMSKLSRADQQTELIGQTSAVGQYGAPFPRLFRPPYGIWNNATLALLHKYRMLMLLWTVDTNDYRQPGVGAIVSSAVTGARPGAIILLHDAGGNRSETVAALPTIISALRHRAYRFVTVPRLLLDNPAPANQQLTPGTLRGGG
jgi:peptidoglycan-N-acetylglucosamine deacetylase